MSNQSWREMILEEMKEYGETWSNVESCTLSDPVLDFKFDSGYGTSEGKPFTLWTKDRVYFPVVYDGAEWAKSVSRNPDGKPTDHVGGQ